MKKHLIFLTSILATTVLSSIGFATWIITVNSDVNAEGNAVVDDIVDKSLGITYKWDNTDSQTTSFVFGWSNETTSATPWLTNSGKNKNGVETIEKLTHTLNISIANTTYLESLKITMTTSGGQWAEAVEKNYVVAPTLGTITKDNITIDSNTNKGTYNLPVKFGWGSLFSNKNPYTYYNNQSFSTTIKENDVETPIKEHALSKIKQLETYLNGVTFTFTISATLVS